MLPEIREFSNEALVDFSQAGPRQAMQAALQQVQQEFGTAYPLIINGSTITTGQKIRSLNPALPREIVGVCARATTTHVDQALAAATQAFGVTPGDDGWRWTTPETRAEFLLKAATVLRRRRYELAAWLILEVGKTWGEADAEVAEAIDFCEFYAREVLRYGRPQSLTAVAGEKNALHYVPLGVGVIIAPWNFPLAILTGMTVAAWGAGNTVVIKPASDGAVVAAKLMEILQEIELPAGVVNYLTGPGSEIGMRLVADPRTRFVAFTGSKDVGLQIVEKAARRVPGQRWIKRVMAEMGGKGAIIVDKDADLAAAVEGVVASAFGYQGQKCSAGSRAIVDAAVYDEFIERCVARTQQFVIGLPEAPETTLGPVINEKQLQTIEQYLELGKTEGRLCCGGARVSREGYFIAPTFFADVEPQARIAQEEIFGPVCAILKAHSFDEALQIANASEYGLTGAVYTRDPKKWALAREQFMVGNLYGNRKCTGAVVGAHPFGGFNLSGTNTKAGGRDYLQGFLQAKTISEKVI